jgi:hypothetical protein
MTNDIFVFDDIVPGWLYESVKKNILSIPVTCQHHGIGPDVGHSFFSKIWPLFGLHEIPWEYKATFAALNDSRDKLSKDDEVMPLHLIQCQLNLTTKTLVGGVHADMGPPAWTMVHFISGDSGMDFWTDYPDNGGRKICDVDYKDNRCVIFPSDIWHRGIPTINVEPRVTLGYIFGGAPQSQYEHDNNIISPIFKKEWSNKLMKTAERNK